MTRKIFLLNIDMNVQVSDTTGDAILTLCWEKKYITYSGEIIFT